MMYVILLTLLLSFGKYVNDAESAAELINSTEVVVIRFCVPFTLSCERTQEDFEEAARISRSLNYSYVDVDCTVSSAICKQYSIYSHPTILVFINKTKHLFQWDYDPENIKNGVTKLKFPLVQIMERYIPTDIHEDEPARAVIITNDTSIIQSIQASAIQLSFVRFIISSNPFYLNGKELSPNEIAYFAYDYSAISSTQFSIDSLLEFCILQNSRTQPLLYGWDTKNILMAYNHTQIIIFYDYNDSYSKEYIKPFRKSVDKNKELIFVEATRKSFPSDTLMALLNIKDTDLPKVVIVRHKKTLESYRMEAPITVDNICSFISNFTHKQIKKYVRSDPVPVIQAVGVTFEEEVLMSKMDVIVKFYNPICKACIAFGKVFASVSTEVPLIANIKFVEIDLTGNDVDDIGGDISYPTIYYYKGDKKSPIEFNGYRTEENFKKFIEETSTIKFKFPIHNQMPEETKTIPKTDL